VNDAPALGANSFTINQNGTLVLSGANLSASDVDSAAAGLVFTVGSLANGYFVFTATGSQTLSFTQADVQSGQIQFVHTGGGAPAFTITVSDGSAGAGPFAANIVFNGGGSIAPPLTGGGDGTTTVTTPTLPPVFPILPAGVPAPGFTAFLRTPGAFGTEEGGAGFVEAVEVVTTPAAGLQTRVITPDTQLPPVRVQGDLIDTTAQRHNIEVEPIRAEMQVIPTRHGLDLDDEAERTQIDVVLNSIRLTGFALSVGAVWWAARAAGLVASLLASSPAWRHVDPLPVLGRDDEEEDEEWDEAAADENERQKKDDEHRAAWVLEDSKLPS
jgi:hypothetical protein